MGVCELRAFAPHFGGDKTIRRIDCIDPAQFSKDARITLRCSYHPEMLIVFACGSPASLARAPHSCCLVPSGPLLPLNLTGAAGCLETLCHPALGVPHSSSWLTGDNERSAPL